MKKEYVKLARKVKVYKLYKDLSWDLNDVPTWVARLMFEGKLGLANNNEIRYYIEGKAGTGKSGDYVVKYSDGKVEFVSEDDFHTYFGTEEVAE